VVSRVNLNELDDATKEKLQNAVASKLTISNSKDFVKGNYFVKDWYPIDDKYRKIKLGSIYECKLKDQEAEMLCRVVTFDRISSY